MSGIAQAGASLGDAGTGAELLSHILPVQKLSLGAKTPSEQQVTEKRRA